MKLKTVLVCLIIFNSLQLCFGSLHGILINMKMAPDILLAGSYQFFNYISCLSEDINNLLTPFFFYSRILILLQKVSGKHFVFL